MLALALPVRTRLRGRPLRFLFTPMTSRGHSPGSICFHVSVETVDEPHEREDIVIEPFDELLWIEIHQVYRARAIFVVPHES